MSAPPNPHGGTVAAFRDALVRWYLDNARDLPWRRAPTPYRVWVSEIMLQQTRVDVVIPYYERFLVRFPNLESLAAASPDDVLAVWSGLGYYRRARMLHAGAREVITRHGGEFPSNAREVRALPGVGDYTAGAIRSIALGEPAPILDGNVKRVLSRVFGIRGDVSKAAATKVLWALAGEVVAEGDPSVVNQAQMELGALVCTPSSPPCGACPVRAICVARRDGLVDRLPELPPKRETVRVERAALLVSRGDEFLLRRRRDDELLRGMWDFPGAFTGAGGDRSTTVADAVALVPFSVRVGDELGKIRHAVTYRRITLRVYAATPHRAERARALPGPDKAEFAWARPPAADALALSSPARRILARWAGSLTP